MRYLILSDIHANIEALEAVMRRARKAGYDRVLCCGDIVGYNANPKAVIDALRLEAAICIRGNHDRESVIAGGDEFNPLAYQAIQWTNGNLPIEYQFWLGDLPKGPLMVTPEIQLVHGAPWDEDEYVYEAAGLLGHPQERRMTFFGHTHIQTAINGKKTITSWDGQRMPRIVDVADGNWYINPGSVGQPRDRDERAAFAIYDDVKKTVQFYRAKYDYRATQKKIRAAGLPRMFATRLQEGR